MKWEIGKTYEIKCEASRAELTKFSSAINRCIVDLLAGRPFRVEDIDDDGDVREITIIGSGLMNSMTLKESLLTVPVYGFGVVSVVSLPKLLLTKKSQNRKKRKKRKNRI